MSMIPMEFDDVKYLTDSKKSASTAASTTGTVTIDLPTGASEVLALVPLAAYPDSSWTGVTGIPVVGVTPSTRTIFFRPLGTQSAQVYVVRYLMIYR